MGQVGCKIFCKLSMLARERPVPITLAKLKVSTSLDPSFISAKLLQIVSIFAKFLRTLFNTEHLWRLDLSSYF